MRFFRLALSILALSSVIPFAAPVASASGPGSTLTLSDGVDASVLDQSTATSLFKKFSSDDQHIPFRYPEDGCYARAHKMCEIAAQEGLTCGKIWLGVDPRYGYLQVETPNAPGGTVQWGYHVAPVFYVKDPQPGAPDHVTAMVFDPSIFDKAVSAADWIRIQVKHKPVMNYVTKFSRPHILYPSESTSNLREATPAALRDKAKTTKMVLDAYQIIQNVREGKPYDPAQVESLVIENLGPDTLPSTLSATRKAKGMK